MKGSYFPSYLTAKGRKPSRLSWQTALEFVPKVITLYLGWPGLLGKSKLFDGLAHGFWHSLHSLEWEVNSHADIFPRHELD